MKSCVCDNTMQMFCTDDLCAWKRNEKESKEKKPKTQILRKRVKSGSRAFSRSGVQPHHYLQFAGFQPAR